MYFFLGIILIVWGFVMVRFPDLVYELTQSWKNYSSGEPSDLFRFSTRFGGVMCILVGIGGVLVPFLK